MLTTLNIANSVLQGNASNLPSAIEMIEECRGDINDFRNAYSLDKIEKGLDTMKSMYSDHDNTQGRGKRQSSLPQRLIRTVHGGNFKQKIRIHDVTCIIIFPNENILDVILK